MPFAMFWPLPMDTAMSDIWTWLPGVFIEVPTMMPLFGAVITGCPAIEAGAGSS